MTALQKWLIILAIWVYVLGMVINGRYWHIYSYAVFDKWTRKVIIVPVIERQQR